MSDSIVLELQQDALDRNVKISDLLRKALVVAKKLKLSEFEAWINSELNGYPLNRYPDDSTLPEYRQIEGEVRAWNPCHGWQPIYFRTSEQAGSLSKRACNQGIAEIESLALEDSDDGSLLMPYHFDVEKRLREAIHRQTQVMTVIPKTAMIRILDAVRNTILNWAMKLEEEGILGEGMSFTTEEKQTAERVASINIEHFQGIIGDVSGGIVTQNLNMSIRAGDLESLSEFLKQNGVAPEDISELEDAIRSDPTPEKPTIYGSLVSSWIGKMVGKAASGAWKVGATVAANLLTKALSEYYSQ